MTAVAFVLAAGVGAAIRHAINRRGYGWRGTMAINVVGAALLGVLLGAGPSDSVVTVLGTGFLGSATTYSMFALEAIESPRRTGLVIVVTTLTVGFLAVVAGHAVT